MRVLYTDGGSRGNGQARQRARMAVFDEALERIVVDDELGSLTNNEAEYRAIEAALQYARREGLGAVEIRSDSLLCVSQIRGEWKIKEERLRAHVVRCQTLLRELGGRITWTPRDQNRAGRYIEGLEDGRATAPGGDGVGSGVAASGGSASQGDARDVPAARPSAHDAVRPTAISDEPTFCIRCGARLRRREVDHRDRPRCPNCGWTYFADPKVAVAAVLRVDDRIVLCRRAIEPGLGRWSFPAGFVDRGEELRSAIVREVLEETALTARIGDLVGVYSQAGNPVVLVVYAGEAEGTPRRSAEASEIATFAPDDLPELAFDHDRGIVADWLKRSDHA